VRVTLASSSARPDLPLGSSVYPTGLGVPSLGKFDGAMAVNMDLLGIRDKMKRAELGTNSGLRVRRDRRRDIVADNPKARLVAVKGRMMLGMPMPTVKNGRFVDNDHLTDRGCDQGKVEAEHEQSRLEWVEKCPSRGHTRLRPVVYERDIEVSLSGHKDEG
jgi:hypothetical protein